jgi:hypothetical protein
VRCWASRGRRCTGIWTRDRVSISAIRWTRVEGGPKRQQCHHHPKKGETPKNTSNPVLVPWIRFLREEANNNIRRINYDQKVVDIIHIGFLEKYIEENIMPFFDVFSRRAKEIPGVFMEKGGMVSSLKKWEYTEIRPGR